MVTNSKEIEEIREKNHIRGIQLENVLNLISEIGSPCNENEKEQLAWAFRMYNALINEVNEEMKYIHKEKSCRGQK